MILSGNVKALSTFHETINHAYSPSPIPLSHLSKYQPHNSVAQKPTIMHAALSSQNWMLGWVRASTYRYEEGHCVGMVKYKTLITSFSILIVLFSFFQ